MPPSPGQRLRQDRIKDTILKESTAGWSNSITPLRIAKRDSMQPSPSQPSTLSSPTRAVARRSSNSYKHVFNNNLVSKSPFKSQIPTPARSSPRNFLVGNGGSAGNGSPKLAPRKVSGEKRPRPDSLVEQAEMENQQRVRELGFKRRQSRAFQGLVEKEPVTKSPFRRIVSPNNIGHEAISIELPTKHHKRYDIKEEDTTSLDTTESESFDDKEDIFSSPPQSFKPAISPSRPLTPLAQPNSAHNFSPSPNFERRSPIPSSMQASPTRSSLVQKPRLMGPRARSFSGSPADTPTRERRKTVTFDERCDVVEFDRASHEDNVFETDDEEVYGPPDGQQDRDSSLESLNASAGTITPTHSPNRSFDRPSVLEVFGVGDDSISGLVDSMLQEASAFGGEPSTPESHTSTFNIARDQELMNGGDENGVPYGRTHHADRVRMHHDEAQYDQPRVPGAFSTEEFDEGNEPSFSSISLSTPPKQSNPLPPIPREGSARTPPSHSGLPPDTDLAEDGMPLGRTHHADRAKAVHSHEVDPVIERDVNIIPPSPSPMKTLANQERRRREHAESLVPKFDLGFDFNLSAIERSRSFADDVFCAAMNEPHPIVELSLEHPDIDPEILSLTDVASFHEFNPQAEGGGAEGEQHRTQLEMGRADISLDASVASILQDLQPERGQIMISGSNDVKINREEANGIPAEDSGASSQENGERPFTPSLANASSQGSLASSGSGRNRSPRISREDVMKRLSKQRSSDNMSSLRAQSPSPVTSPKGMEQDVSMSQRQPLEERLKRALSPQPASPSKAPAGPSPIPEKQSTPSRADLQVRAHTYDFNGRPLAPSPLTASFDFNGPGVDIADMRSALDRLVDDVSGVEGHASIASARGTRSTTMNSDGDVSMADTEPFTEESTELLANLKESFDSRPGPVPLQRAGTAPAAPLLPSTFIAAPAQSRSASSGSIPPAPPAKDSGKSARQEREELIREKRREARARDSGEFIPPRRDSGGNLLPGEGSPATRQKSRSSGRPSARRSLSTGDAEDMMSNNTAAQRRVSVLKNQLGGVLGMTLEDDEDPLADTIERELKRKTSDTSKKKTYELVEREAVVYASSSNEESISHMARVGDLDSGRAWRTVRRPSDMNEYSRQIKELRAQEKSGKAHGKIFVKVLRIKGMNVPLPNEQTFFSCTLNNGIHFVTTPDSVLTRDAKIEQEFELIEHTKLEFTLTIKVRRDQHILQQFKAHAPSPPPSQPAAAPSHRSGVRSFFGGASKKPKHVRANTETAIPHIILDNLARYLKPDGTLARAFVAFKDIAPRCDTKLFETSFPLIGQRLDSPGKGAGVNGTLQPMQIGEIILQIFRLPPLSGIPQNELPQSLDDCHRGLRHVNWHKVTYHEGVLTQLGGDCSTWRRRKLRVIGGSLVAFNDVTKRATATIDLKKALAIEDDQELVQSPTIAHRDVDDFDAMYGVERSFRLIFPHRQEITFFADTDEEKARWLEVLRALVGHIPPNPLWAELVWQRQNELAKAAAPSSTTQNGQRAQRSR